MLKINVNVTVSLKQLNISLNIVGEEKMSQEKASR